MAGYRRTQMGFHTSHGWYLPMGVRSPERGPAYALRCTRCDSVGPWANTPTEAMDEALRAGWTLVIVSRYGQQAGSPMDEAHCPSCRNLMTEQQRLQHLRRLANDALDAAEAAGIEDAVNWGDLSCVEAALVLTDEGRSYYRVMIEEASPDAYKLGVYVRDWLAKRGWTDVEGLTEW